MKLSKVVLSIAATIALAALAAGCGSGSKSAGSGKATELRIFTWNQDPAGAKREQAVFDQFTKDTGIKVKQVVAPYDKYNDKFLTMASSQTLPDLTWIMADSFKTVADKKLLLDLKPYMKQIDKSKYLPNALSIGQVNGKQYGLPRDMASQQIGINTDMLKKAGLSMPPDNWNIDQFLDYAKKLTQVQNGKTQVFGIDNFYALPLSLSFSGHYITNEAGTKVTIDEPNDAKAIQFASDLVNKYHVSPTSAQSQGISNMFIAQKSAMAIVGPWDWQNIKENGKFNFDVVPIPTAGKQSKKPLSALAIGIAANTKHPKEAFKFLKWLSQGRGQALQMSGVGAVPVIKSQVHDLEKTDFAPKNAGSLIKTLNTSPMSKGTPYSKDAAQLNNDGSNEFSNIIQKNLNAQKELVKFAKTLRQKYNLK